MTLPKNDPYAKVANSLEHLFLIHNQEPKVEVSFYPACDVQSDMLDILNLLALQQKNFSIDIQYDLKTCEVNELRHSVTSSNMSQKFNSFELWFQSVVPYIGFCANISIENAQIFAKWSYDEMFKHIKFMVPLCKRRGFRKDYHVTASIRTGQHNSETTGSNVLYYHKDRQRYTAIKNYIGPTTVYAERGMFYEYPSSIWGIPVKMPSALARAHFNEYSLPNTGVSVHKGQIATHYLKTFHLAQVGKGSKNKRMLLIAFTT